MNNPHIDNYGIRRWYNEVGQSHRLDGPAVIYPDYLSCGYQVWRQNGKLHRLDGPAVEFNNSDNNDKQWWINNQVLTELEFKQKIIELNKLCKICQKHFSNL